MEIVFKKTKEKYVPKPGDWFTMSDGALYYAINGEKFIPMAHDSGCFWADIIVRRFDDYSLLKYTFVGRVEKYIF